LPIRQCVAVKEDNPQRADIDIPEATLESPQWISAQSQRSGSALIQESTADAAFGIWKQKGIDGLKPKAACFWTSECSAGDSPARVSRSMAGGTPALQKIATKVLSKSPFTPLDLRVPAPMRENVSPLFLPGLFADHLHRLLDPGF
jgi:hypothetical protein